MKQAACFVALTFALSWGAWGLAIALGSGAEIWRMAGAFGPTLAALILAWRAGRGEMRRLLAGFRRWRAAPWIWAFALFSTAALGLAALALESVRSGAPDWPDAGQLLLVPVIFLWVLVFSVAGEETGWRGYLLPRLLHRTGPVTASLGLGLVWGLWHLPLWALPGEFHAAIPVPLFMTQALAVSILHTWLWLRSAGSLIVAHVFHAASNTTLGVLPLIPGAGADGPGALWIAVGLLWLCAGGVAIGLARRPGTVA